MELGKSEKLQGIYDLSVFISVDLCQGSLWSERQPVR